MWLFLSRFLKYEIGYLHHFNAIYSDLPFKFFYNWIELSVSSYGEVEDYFKNDLDPIVTLYDPENDIKLINVIFRDNYGNQVETISNHDRSMGNLLHFYLKKQEHNFGKRLKKIYNLSIIKKILNIIITKP